MAVARDRPWKRRGLLETWRDVGLRLRLVEDPTPNCHSGVQVGLSRLRTRQILIKTLFSVKGATEIKCCMDGGALE